MNKPFVVVSVVVCVLFFACILLIAGEKSAERRIYRNICQDKCNLAKPDPLKRAEPLSELLVLSNGNYVCMCANQFLEIIKVP